MCREEAYEKQPVNTEHDLRLLELRRELRDTARELHFAYDRFNYVTDPGPHRGRYLRHQRPEIPL
ncbi:MAG: hypothetical protein ACLUNQ_09610 [Oscillospiraceae bacterium]